MVPVVSWRIDATTRPLRSRSLSSIGGASPEDTDLPASPSGSRALLVIPKKHEYLKQVSDCKCVEALYVQAERATGKCRVSEVFVELSWDIQSLFRRHAQEIERFLRRRGHNPETAADITQDTFLKILVSPPAERNDGYNPRAYLYRVSRNLSINHHRRESLIQITDLSDPEASGIADPSPSAEAVVYSRQYLAQVDLALAELPERTRRAFEMHRLGERTIVDVAEELGLSTGRTWTLIRDAYRHLLARVGEF